MVHAHTHLIIRRRKRGIFWSIVLNLGFSFFELAAGVLANSLAVISNAIHDFADSLSFALAYWGVALSEKAPTKRFTFGYGKAPIFIAFASSLALAVVTFFIIAEAWKRLRAPAALLNPPLILGIAVAGILVNGIATWLLAKDRKSLNIRAAILHLLGDFAGWFLVLAMAIVLMYTNWYFLDPLLTLLISAFILWGSLMVIREGTKIFLDIAPSHIQYDAVKKFVLEHSRQINDVHDLHIWHMGEEEISLSAHCTIKKISMSESQNLLRELKTALKEKFAVSHAVIELECPSCSDGVCEPTGE